MMVVKERRREKERKKTSAVIKTTNLDRKQMNVDFFFTSSHFT
jgi:hypothetical protein